MANVNYSQVDTHGEGTSNAMSTSNQNTSRTKATGSYIMYAREAAGTNNDNRKDSELSSMSAWGDLA